MKENKICGKEYKNHSIHANINRVAGKLKNPFSFETNNYNRYIIRTAFLFVFLSDLLPVTES
jgi:hypothetical protein